MAFSSYFSILSSLREMIFGTPDLFGLVSDFSDFNNSFCFPIVSASFHSKKVFFAFCYYFFFVLHNELSFNSLYQQVTLSA